MAGQALQRGQVLDLQVIGCDFAVFDGAVVEFIEKLLEHVVYANACQNVALLYLVVQRLWDVTFVTGRIKKREES